MVDRVDGVDRLQHILNGAELGVLASLKGEALVAHILKGDNLAAYLLLRKLTAGNSLILSVIGAVDAAIHAVVREVQGCEHHDAVAVDLLLELTRNGKDALLDLLILYLDKYRSLTVRDALALFGLGENLLDECSVVAVLACPLQCGAYLAVVDKLGGVLRLYIIFLIM